MSPQQDETPGKATVTMLNLQMNNLGPTVPVDNIMVEVVPGKRHEREDVPLRAREPEQPVQVTDIAKKRPRTGWLGVLDRCQSGADALAYLLVRP